MAGLLSGLAGLGLGNLAEVDLFEKPKTESTEQKKVIAQAEEKDFIYDRTFTCPVCDANFTAKVMKSGKAKLVGTDDDMRPRYEGIDAVKYDVQLCPQCGYTALSRFFPNITGGQARLIRENISKKVRLHPYDGEIYTYDEALERYQLALANAVVKRSRASEKAYICLKSAWLLRGQAEELLEKGENTQNVDALKEREEEFLLNAYNGFAEARQGEPFPMCGMDEITVDYLLAQLATHFKKYDVASRLVASILASPSANARIKDKVRTLKDQILTDLKNK